MKSIDFGNIKITGNSLEEVVKNTPKSVLNEIATEYPLHDIPEEVAKGPWKFKYVNSKEDKEPEFEGIIIY